MEGIDWGTAYGCDPEKLRKMSVDAGLVVAAQRGLRFTYHNHDLEIKKYADGSCGLDNVIKNTDPAAVGFELDVYWVKKGGQDPVEYIKNTVHAFGSCT